MLPGNMMAQPMLSYMTVQFNQGERLQPTKPTTP